MPPFDTITLLMPLPPRDQPTDISALSGEAALCYSLLVADANEAVRSQSRVAFSLCTWSGCDKPAADVIAAWLRVSQGLIDSARAGLA